jgi:hypothetical protein
MTTEFWKKRRSSEYIAYKDDHPRVNLMTSNGFLIFLRDKSILSAKASSDHSCNSFKLQGPILNDTWTDCDYCQPHSRMLKQAHRLALAFLFCSLPNSPISSPPQWDTVLSNWGSLSPQSSSQDSVFLFARQSRWISWWISSRNRALKFNSMALT